MHHHGAGSITGSGRFERLAILCRIRNGYHRQSGIRGRSRAYFPGFESFFRQGFDQIVIALRNDESFLERLVVLDNRPGLERRAL